MNILPHIPLLSTVFVGMGYYLFPFSIVLLWFLNDSRKTKYLLLVALVLLSMICMFLEEACCPSREYPWDCMVECIFKGMLVPLLCLLGYTVYVFLCTCLPSGKNKWKGVGFVALGVMSLAFEYVNASFSIMLLTGYFLLFIMRRKFQSHAPLVRKCNAVLALGVIPGICVIGVVCAVLFPPPQDYLCERIQEEMKRDMAVWNYRNNLMLLSSRFLGMEQGSDGITVKYYCETNMGPAVYKAFCNGYGGYKRAECVLLKK